MAAALSSQEPKSHTIEDIVIPDHVYCPICRQIMKNPVQLNGVKEYTFCGFCISQWLKLKKSNPMTNEPLTDIVLIPDKKLISEIKDLYSDAKQLCDWLIIKANHNHDNHQNDSNKNKAIAAKEWFDDQLIHLQSEYEWTPWMKQTALNAIQALINKISCYSSSSNISEIKQFNDDDETLNDDDDMFKNDEIEKELIEFVEQIIYKSDNENDDDEKQESEMEEEQQENESWKKQIEQIRVEGKKIIDYKCNETIERIEVLSNESSMNYQERDRILCECEHSVTYISSIIDAVDRAVKNLTGWISQFFFFYVNKVLTFLGNIYVKDAIIS